MNKTASVGGLRGSHIDTSLLVVIVALLVLRFIQLEIDPPYFFARFSQAHLTDPYHLTFAARNAVLFGDWHPFDYHRWDVFAYSLVSGVSWVLFSLFGVSRVTANLAGVLLGVGGMLFFVLGLRGYRNRREVIITALVLLLSSMLFFYGRLPFLETGLIFLSGMTFFIFMRYHHRWWGRILSGFLIVIAALAGKLFGLILLAPVLITLWYEYRRRAIKPMLFAVGGAVFGMVLYALLFYGGDVSVMIAYYTEQTTGMYGVPRGLVSPLGFIVQLLTFGSDNGLLTFSPFLTMLTILGLGTLPFVIPSHADNDRSHLPMLFCAFWLVAGVLGLMPFNYRPLRYALFLFLPASVLCAYLITLVSEKKIILKNSMPDLATALVFILAWYVVTNVSHLFLGESDGTINGIVVIIITAAIALVIAVIVHWRLKKRERSYKRLIPAGIVLVLVFGMVVRQGWLLYEGLALPGTYLRDFNREISEMVSPDAVLTGPYTPALTIDNKLKGIIYVFGLANREKDLFDRFPISHVVTDRSNYDLGVKDFPALQAALSLRRMRLREGSVEILRMPGAQVPMTDYERAAAAYGEKQFDSALFFSQRFADRYPDNLCGRFGLTTAYYIKGDIGEFLGNLEKIASDFPDNFRAHMFCKEFYEVALRATKDSKYDRLVKYHYARAREINPALP
ncbi:MAG: hypothetical protein JW763_08975 [candidate division Zixibacteria bacterium]|nr:hypothetical protein [candidate division Zixibacteria bacterium]